MPVHLRLSALLIGQVTPLGVLKEAVVLGLKGGEMGGPGVPAGHGEDPGDECIEQH